MSPDMCEKMSGQNREKRGKRRKMDVGKWITRFGLLG